MVKYIKYTIHRCRRIRQDKGITHGSTVRFFLFYLSKKEKKKAGTSNALATRVLARIMLGRGGSCIANPRRRIDRRREEEEEEEE